MNIPMPGRDLLPGSYRPTAAKPLLVPLFAAPIQENPDIDPDQLGPPPGPSQSSAGSHLSGGGYSLAASPPPEPWVEIVRAYFEDLRLGAWSRVLHRSGCPVHRVARLGGLKQRLRIQLREFNLVDAGSANPECARVTVFEDLISNQQELARAATFRVERKDGKWHIQDVEGWGMEPSQLDQYLLWARLTGKFPQPMLEHGLGALLWFLGKLACDPRVGLWCWSTRLAYLGWLPLALHRPSARWRPRVGGADLLAWAEARLV